MQPYFLPYIGYIQLLHAADIFVFHDNVQYIKGGWINRNRIRRGESFEWLTLPVRQAAHDLAINRRVYALEGGGREKLKRRIRAAYREAEAFGEATEFFDHVIEYSDPNVARFNINALRVLVRRLGIRCRLEVASDLGIADDLHGAHRVLDICRKLGATRYINPIGGTDLYEESAFAAAGLELRFLRTGIPPETFGDGRSYLSIMDLIFVSGFQGVRRVLPRYRLEPRATAKTSGV